MDGGDEAGKQLDRLISLKNDAQYGFYNVSAGELTRALRQAKALIRFAERLILG